MLFALKKDSLCGLSLLRLFYDAATVDSVVETVVDAVVEVVVSDFAVVSADLLGTYSKVKQWERIL